MAPGQDSLTPHGRALLKQLHGNTGQIRPTAAAVARFGADQPDSVLEVIPEALANAALALPDELFKTPEHELESLAQVTRQDRRIRIRFWEEYEVCHRTLSQMDLTKVVADTGVPTWGYYWEKLTRTPALLVWLMQPPAAYRLQMQEASELGLRRLVDILQLPLTKPSGAVDAGVGLLILQAIKMVDQRLHGSVTQKVLSVNLSAGDKPEEGSISMDEVDRKLKELEDELSAATPQALAAPAEKPEPKDVASSVSDPPG